MANIIVVFPKPEDAKSIRNILTRNGFSVTAVCTTGAQALNAAEDQEYSIVVCGYRFSDMDFSELRSYLPGHIAMLLIASRSRWAGIEKEDLVCVDMPLKLHDLLNTLEMLQRTQDARRRKKRSRPAVRSDEDRAVIDKAKKLLMERNNMTENEAHRYIQKCSMDSGTNMVETAHMILSIMR